MKVELTNQPKQFQPVTLQVTLDTPEEFLALYLFTGALSVVNVRSIVAENADSHGQNSNAVASLALYTTNSIYSALGKAAPTLRYRKADIEAFLALFKEAD